MSRPKHSLVISGTWIVLQWLWFWKHGLLPFVDQVVWEWGQHIVEQSCSSPWRCSRQNYLAMAKHTPIVYWEFPNFYKKHVFPKYTMQYTLCSVLSSFCLASLQEAVGHGQGWSPDIPGVHRCYAPDLHCQARVHSASGAGCHHHPPSLGEKLFVISILSQFMSCQALIGVQK